MIIKDDKLGFFEVNGNPIAIYTDSRQAPTKFYHQPSFIVQRNSDGSLSTRVEHTEGVYVNFTVLLKSDLISQKALEAVHKKGYGEVQEVGIVPFSRFAVSIHDECTLPAGVRLIFTSQEGFSHNSWELKFFAPNLNAAKELEEKTDQISVKFTYQVFGATVLENRMKANARTVLMAEFNTFLQANKIEYVHRDDARKMLNEFRTTIQVDIILEDPDLPFNWSPILNKALETILKGSFGTRIAACKETKESTFNQRDLDPDTINHHLQKLFTRNKDTDDFSFNRHYLQELEKVNSQRGSNQSSLKNSSSEAKSTNGSMKVDVPFYGSASGSGGHASSEASSQESSSSSQMALYNAARDLQSGSYTFDQLKKCFNEHDIEIERNGEMIEAKTIYVRQCNNFMNMDDFSLEERVTKITNTIFEDRLDVALTKRVDRPPQQAGSPSYHDLLAEYIAKTMSLETEMKDLKTKATALETITTTLKTDAGKLETAILETIEDRNGTLKARATDLEARTTTLETKTNNLEANSPRSFLSLIRLHLNQPSVTFGSLGHGDGQFDTPHALAFNSQGDILVADYSNHRIQVFNKQGGYISQFSAHGNGNGQHFFPVGLFFDNVTRRILVSEDGNNRISIFDEEGSFIRAFGSFGSGDGEFQTPRGVCVDAVGNIFVADLGNHRIQVFNGDGIFLRKFGGVGNENGRLNYPFGIRVNSRGEVVVSEYNNHRISVFDRNGNFSRHVGVGRLNRPYHIEIGSEDRIFVANWEANNVLVFGKDGKLLNEGAIPTPTAIALTPDGTLAVSSGQNVVALF